MLFPATGAIVSVVTMDEPMAALAMLSCISPGRDA